MAMIKCPDCKTPISDSAECCPRCGCKFRAEYEEMQRLRQRIYEMEHDRSVRPAEPSGGIGGCSIVSILLLIAAVAVVIYGFFMFVEWGSVETRLTGLLIMVGGGFIAFGCFAIAVGFVGGDVEANQKQRANVAYYDRQQAERPARIAEAKRRLAQLEQKFR